MGANHTPTRFVETRPFIDAVARVKTYLLSRDSAECKVDRIDIDLSAPLNLSIVETGFDENVWQERIIDLDKKARSDDWDE